MGWSKYQEAIFDFVENSNESAVISARAGSGKGGWVNSIIPTPYGDKRFGDLKVGDYVFDRYGNPTKILGVYPRGFMDAYRVTLNDGRSTICSIDHLWGVEYLSHKIYKYKVISLEEMLKKGYIKKDKRPNRTGSCKFYVPMSGPHHYLNSKKLSVNPYVLGVSIGNECLSEKQNGHIIQTKEIPEEYLYSSFEDRISLLQGLFDTNGCITNGGVTYSTTSNKLIKQIYNLLLSVGIVSNISKNTNKECFSLLVKCSFDKLQTLFSLERKKNKCKVLRQTKHHYEHVGIRNIEKLPQQLEIQCIYVDSPDHLYLCEDSIVTHNTTTIVECSKRIPSNKSVLFLAFNKSIAQELQNRMSDYPNVLCKTLHSHGYGAIQTYKKTRLTLDNKKWYSYLWDNLSVLSNTTFPDTQELYSFISRCLTLFDLCRINLIEAKDPSKTMKEIDNIAYHHGIFEEYDEYSVVYSLLEIAYNLEDSTIDFTDMIVLPCMHNGIKKCIRKYDVIFVDECQDLSKAQQVLLKNSIKYKGRFIAVGDENQSITGYAGSDCDSFSKMKELAKGKEFPLSVCYRCGKKIINLAKEFVPAIEPYEENSDGEIKVVKDLTDVKPGDVILSRKSAPTISLCLKFIANGIPAKVKGRDMLEGLKKVVEKSKATNFEGLYQYLDKEYKKIIKKITNRGDKEPENAIQAITFRDKIECIKSIAESCNEFSDMGNKLDTLFSDYTDGRFVTLSTIHKAKGLEWDRVFIILPKDIPLKWKNQQEWEYQQEINLKYVAITRAKKELFFVNLDLDQLLTCQLP